MEEYKFGCVYIGKFVLDLAKAIHENDISPEVKAKIDKETNEILERVKRDGRGGK